MYIYDAAGKKREVTNLRQASILLTSAIYRPGVVWRAVGVVREGVGTGVRTARRVRPVQVARGVRVTARLQVWPGPQVRTYSGPLSGPTPGRYPVTARPPPTPPTPPTPRDDPLLLLGGAEHAGPPGAAGGRGAGESGERRPRGVGLRAGAGGLSGKRPRTSKHTQCPTL